VAFISLAVLKDLSLQYYYVLVHIYEADVPYRKKGRPAPSWISPLLTASSIMGGIFCYTLVMSICFCPSNCNLAAMCIKSWLHVAIHGRLGIMDCWWSMNYWQTWWS